MFINFSSTLLTTKRRLTGFLVVNFSPSFLNTGTTDETFQQPGKQDSFRYILKISPGMHESLGSQFFRITTRIQSGQDSFDESGLIMSFLTN